MEMKRLISVAIAFAMLAVGFSMVSTHNVKAGFISNPAVTWSGTFMPRDTVWDDGGHYCLVVGQETISGPNAYVYNAYSGTWSPVTAGTPLQILTSATYDVNTQSFWFAGDTTGAPASTVWIMPKAGNVASIPTGAGRPAAAITTIEADTTGNVLVGTILGGQMYSYNKGNNLWYSYSVGTVWSFNSITFNPNNSQFYIAGYLSVPGEAGILVSSTAPLNGGSTFAPGTYPNGITVFNSIDWNTAQNCAMVVGDGIYRFTPTFTWTTIEAAPATSNIYFDVAWDSDGWDEAAIVGNNGARGIYMRYYVSNPTLIMGYTDATITNYYCVSIKPPASPKFVFIPTSGGAVAADIEALDQSTRITANAVFPKLYWIGFNDTSMVSRMEQQVLVEADYWFTLEGNYSEGWNNCEVVIEAWFDNGNVGAASTYAPNADYTRNLAFRLTWTVGAPNAAVSYPSTPELEITTGAVIDSERAFPNPISSPVNHHQVAIPVWLGNQIRTASGTGFVSGDANYAPLKTGSLMDPGSWDFSVALRDSISTTAAATLYAEFGVQTTSRIQVSGSPSGNAPPGSNDNAMGPNSNIVYSSNAPYRIDVAIPNLYQNGNPASPNWIPSGSVSARNTHMNVTAGNSDLSAETTFTVPNAPLYVWGVLATPIAPANNGLISAGPWMTDFTTPATCFTELYWEVDVPGATPEGIYWGVISVSISN